MIPQRTRIQVAQVRPLVLYVSLILGVTGSCSQAVDIPPSQHEAVLRMLAAQNKQTWDGLKTWRGTCEIETTARYDGDEAKAFLDRRAGTLNSRPAEFRRRIKGQASFVLNLVSDQSFSRLTTDTEDFADLTTGRPFALDPPPSLSQLASEGTLVLDQPRNITAILTPDEFLYLDPSLSPGSLERTAFREARDAANGLWLADPRELLTYGGQPIWTELQRIADAVSKNGWPTIDGQELRISKQGNDAYASYHLVVPARVGGSDALLIEMSFQAKAGLNLTMHQTRRAAGPVEQRIQWDYDRTDGLVLPNHYQREWMNADGSQPRSQLTITILSSEANSPVSPEMFQPQNLGLQEGDRLVDKLAGGRVSVMKAGRLQPISGTGQGPPPNAPGQ